MFVNQSECLGMTSVPPQRMLYGQVLFPTHQFCGKKLEKQVTGPVVLLILKLLKSCDLPRDHVSGQTTLGARAEGGHTGDGMETM